MLRLFSWLIIAVLVFWSLGPGRIVPAKNPDPNHTHADFGVWVGKERIDFSKPEYMSGASTDSEHDVKDPKRKFLHLHDGNGSVMHRHKPGLTLGEFFDSLGMPMSSNWNTAPCFTLPKLGKVCSGGSKQWRFFVNVEEKDAHTAASYVFNDLDRIALIYDPDDGTFPTRDSLMALVDQLTDDSCKYSQACPEQGPPPTENCIADPEVPCTQ